jgi:hypothetical protein
MTVRQIVFLNTEAEFQSKSLKVEAATLTANPPDTNRLLKMPA